MSFKAITIMNDTDLDTLKNNQDRLAFDESSRRDEDSSSGDDNDWCADSGGSFSGGITTISNVIDGQCCHHSKTLFEVVDVYDGHGSSSLQSNDDSNVDSFDSYFKMQRDGPMVPGTDIPQSRLSMYQDSAGDEVESRPPAHDDWDSEREGGSSLSSITNDFFIRNLTAATSAIGGWTRRHAISPASFQNSSPNSRSRKTLGVGSSPRRRMHWFSARTVNGSQPNASGSTPPEGTPRTETRLIPPWEVMVSPGPQFPLAGLLRLPSSAPSICSSIGSQLFTNELRERYSANIVRSYHGGLAQFKGMSWKKKMGIFFSCMALFIGIICITSIGTTGGDNSSPVGEESKIQKNYELGLLDRDGSLPENCCLENYDGLSPIDDESLLAPIDHSDGETSVPPEGSVTAATVPQQITRTTILPQESDPIIVFEQAGVNSPPVGRNPSSSPVEQNPEPDDQESSSSLSNTSSTESSVITNNLPSLQPSIEVTTTAPPSTTKSVQSSSNVPTVLKGEPTQNPITNPTASAQIPTGSNLQQPTTLTPTTSPIKKPTKAPAQLPIESKETTKGPTTPTTPNPTNSPSKGNGASPTPKPEPPVKEPTQKATKIPSHEPSKSPSTKPQVVKEPSGQSGGGGGGGGGNPKPPGGGNPPVIVTPKSSMLHLKASADTYVDQSSKSRGYGGDSELRVRGGGSTEVYIRFDVSSFLQNEIADAELKLQALPSASVGVDDIFDDGNESSSMNVLVDVIFDSDSSDVSSITWDNNPLKSSASIHASVFSVVTPNDQLELYEINVKSAFQQFPRDEGLFLSPIVIYVMLSSQSSGSVSFASKEWNGGSSTPELIVVWSEEGSTEHPTSVPTHDPSSIPSAVPSSSSGTNEPTIGPNATTPNPTASSEVSPTSNPAVSSDSPTAESSVNTVSPTTSPIAVEMPGTTNSPIVSPDIARPTHGQNSSMIPSTPPMEYSSPPSTTKPTTPNATATPSKQTGAPTTQAPISTTKPSSVSSSAGPTQAPITGSPTKDPTSEPATKSPSIGPTSPPTTDSPSKTLTPPPTTIKPTNKPTNIPTSSPTLCVNRKWHINASGTKCSNIDENRSNVWFATLEQCCREHFGGFDSCPKENVCVSDVPTRKPTMPPTSPSTNNQSVSPPTNKPATSNPTKKPTNPPTNHTPTKTPTTLPTKLPTTNPTTVPTKMPTKNPTTQPTKVPTKMPTKQPTKEPTKEPTEMPTKQPTKRPTELPTKPPTKPPTPEPAESALVASEDEEDDDEIEI